MMISTLDTHGVVLVFAAVLALNVAPRVATGTGEHAEVILQNIGGVLSVLDTLEGSSLSTCPGFLVTGDVAPGSSTIISDSGIVGALLDGMLEALSVVAVDMPVVVAVVVAGLAVGVETGGAGDGVPVHMEVAVVDHVITGSVASGTVHRPEARVRAELTSLPETLGVE